MDIWICASRIIVLPSSLKNSLVARFPSVLACDSLLRNSLEDSGIGAGYVSERHSPIPALPYLTVLLDLLKDSWSILLALLQEGWGEEKDLSIPDTGAVCPCSVLNRWIQKAALRLLPVSGVDKSLSFFSPVSSSSPCRRERLRVSLPFSRLLRKKLICNASF